MPIALFPRPSILSTLVVGSSLAAGMMAGAMAAGALLLAARLSRIGRA